MSPEDYKLIQALAKCVFQPASWPKRFARDLAQYPPEKELSEKQRAALAHTAWHYRKQLAGHGVTITTKPGTDPSADDQAKLAAWNEGRPL